MSYFCKNCGAVVTGKYCSCCGTKAKSDFEDYCSERNALSRELRKMSNRFFSSVEDQVISEFAMNLARKKAELTNGVVPLHSETSFRADPKARYEELRKTKSEAVKLYIGIMRVIGYSVDDLLKEATK